MSRIGLKAIDLPKEVTFSQANGVCSIKGPKGSLDVKIPFGIVVEVKDDKVHCSRQDDAYKANHGTARALLHNAIVGVTKGFKKEITIVGIGFRAAMVGNVLNLHIGFSHEVNIVPEKGVKVTCIDPTNIVVEGIDRQAVGQTAANIRAVRKPEPYQGKGISYKGEHILRREGKRAGKK